MLDKSENLSARVKKLEQQNANLQTELGRLRTLVDTPHNIMLFSFDLKYRYITYNKAHRDFIQFNWGVDIHPGMTIFDIFATDEERTSARAHFDRVLSGESYILKRNYKRQKGDTRFYENTYIPIIENGTITGATVFAHDITEWSEKEEEGRKYRSIFDKALEGIFRSTKEGRFIEANREMARILGYDSPEDLMESVQDISSQLYVDPRDREIVFSRLRDESVIKDFETRMRRKDGSEIWVEFNTRCERDESGRTEYVEGKLTDITTRKQAEAKAEAHRQQMIQADKMASLGVLVAGVAHEINNPNSYLTLNLPLLQDIWNDLQPLLDEYVEDNGEFVLGGLEYSEIRHQLPYLLQEMLAGSLRIKDIVTRLKDYSRQNPEENREHVSLVAIVQGALAFVRHEIKHSGAELVFDIPEDSPTIEANPQRLIQVLINLIMNACEALPGSGGTLTITIGQAENGEGVPCPSITVADTGHGISPNDLKVIQDPFFTTKRDSGGTGLGLSISATIMQEHGGSLQVESEEDRGTKVIMIFG